MSGAREIIEILSKIFCDNGTSEIKAESFRSAKFDKDIATPSLWRLLFQLIYFLQHNVMDENPKDLANQLKAEELVAYTKRVMQDHGYFCEDFSKLPDDMTKGSREVLLAVGWLISTKKVIDRLIDLKALLFNQEFPTAQTVVLDQSEFHENSKNDILHRVRKLQLLNGQLHLSLKRLHGLYREETKLQHRIHECTAGVGSLSHRQHLSVFEVHLLRHPDQLKKSLKQLEKDNSRLEYILQWKEHEDIFWKWMESVLQLKMEERSSEATSRPFLHYNIPTDLVRKVSLVRRSLEAKIMKLDPIITQLEELWETKQEDLPVKSVRKIDTAFKSEIDLMKHKICMDMFQSNDSVFPSLYQNSRLVYIKPQKKKVPTVQIPELSNIAEDNLIDIKDETNILMDHISRLECEIMRKERFYKTVLDEMAADIPGAICIQPASLTRTER